MDEEALLLAPAVLQNMVDHALRERPNECCGLLAGRARFAEAIFPLVNEAHSPTRFRAAAGLIEPFRLMRKQGWELVAVYHSHPTSEALPSRTDLAENYYPDVVHVIISLSGPSPGVRAFILASDDYREVCWKTSPSG